MTALGQQLMRIFYYLQVVKALSVSNIGSQTAALQSC
jgi:hypothetical protein